MESILWRLALLAVASAQAPVINRAPQFLPNGDMSRFAISEDTPPGSPVYKLQGSDPEGSRVFYSISGDYFTVDRYSGVVSTVKALDREQQDFITVVISVTDEGIGGTEPNTVSLLREIPVLDINDNAPMFLHRPYAISVTESTAPGTDIFKNITVQDKDGGVNGDVILSCIPNDDPACRTFDITTDKVAEGIYQGTITLRKALDFELQRSYSLTVRATDRAKDPAKRLSATANVVIEVLDVQDQLPVFINAPYSASIPENTEESIAVLRIGARDGDVGDPRQVRIDILDDILNCFALQQVTGNANSSDVISWYDLITTDNALDRENPDILLSGGIYSFRLRATELINGELPADYTDTTVTIVVTDMDDQLPVFNQREFHINVSEAISTDSPLPSLNMIVVDADVGENARYHLSLRDLSESAGAVSIHPQMGQGHTAVLIRANDTSLLDFDARDEDNRILVFDVVAGVENEYGVVREVSSSRVFAHLQDANDNSPEFSNSSYSLTIPENVEPNTLIANIQASDKDTGLFGQITYQVRGFGSNMFRTDPKRGGIYVGNSSLDYEKQKSYTLSLIATDGGNRSSSINIYIEIKDVNDNKPKFDLKEFSRTVRTKSTSFQPEFFIHAEDIDGPQQGGGKIKYEVIEKNFEGDVIDVDAETGEVEIHEEVSPEHTPKGQYELKVRAWDYGTPKLYDDTRVNVRVGYTGNQRPYFRGNAKNSNGISFYNFTVREDIKPKTDIYQLDAVDPDGGSGQLSYFIPINGKDNFEIDAKSGILRTSTFVDLDLDRNPMHYQLKVEVVDAGYPISETGTVEVLVNIQDVNNKPPYFADDSFTFYVRDDVEKNTTVGNIQASDPDEMPNIRYKIIPPTVFFDKAGLMIPEDNIFSITDTGDIILNDQLPSQVNNVVLKVEAEDINGETANQTATTEVLIYVQSKHDMNPIFVDSNWTPKNPVIHIDLDEEMPKNTAFYTLKAVDPFDATRAIEFQTLTNDYSDIFNIDEGGQIVLRKRLDYENSPMKVFNITVRAVIVGDIMYEVDRSNSKEGILDLQQLPQVRYSDAILEIELKNINDFAPIFEQNLYRKRVLENVKPSEILLTVKAVDFDNDTVTYSISGETSAYFTMNSTTGALKLAKNSNLDREKQNIYKMTVTAMDNGRGESHMSHADILIEVLDVNDNPPIFTQPEYSTVIAENVAVGTKIVNVKAEDPDVGLSGEVTYKLIADNEASSLFTIDPESGDVVTNRVLTGRGRSEPYRVTIRAADKGDLVLDAEGRRTQQSLSSETSLVVFIGDVVRNDGVPVFIRPQPSQRATVSENASMSTPVFQVIATDPDDPNSPEGQIRYKLLKDGKQDQLPFKINAETGLITTKSLLDREKKSLYQIVIVAHDLGDVPQEATALLEIDVLDVDDHVPMFQRDVHAVPQQMSLVEESEIGTEVGLVQCIDEDVGDNALIDYIISDGNNDNLFTIERTDENVALLRVNGRLDREAVASHLLTVKCFKMEANGHKLNYLRPYNAKDLSEMQILVTLTDIDDNGPVFPVNNITLGVRIKVPPDSRLATLEAIDVDSDAAPLNYQIANVTFRSLAKGIRNPLTLPANHIFSIGQTSGELRTLTSIHNFTDGYFEVLVFVNNTLDGSRRGNLTARIFPLRDRSLLKLVINKSPREVNLVIPEIEKAMAQALLVHAVNIYDTQYLTKKDGSLDFSSTSSCFQVIGNKSYTMDELERLLNTSKNAKLRQIFSEFEVARVEKCAERGSSKMTSWVQIWVLTVAAAIGVLAFIAATSICCCYASYARRYRRDIKRRERALVAEYMSTRNPVAMLRRAPSAIGSQVLSHKHEQSFKGSQLTLGKGGPSLLLSQPATQMGSQLIINAPNHSAIMSEPCEAMSSQLVYEYVHEGNDNLAYDHS